jgi:glycosyltransferase involved in cell wall biosynthesis
VTSEGKRLRVLMISKALVVGAYQRKLEEIAAYPDIDLTVVVPRTWAGQRYEPAFVHGYRTLVEPIRFDGNFHLFYLPTLGRIIGQTRPDIVHIDEEPYNLATVLAAYQARRHGARTVFFTWQNLLRRYPPPFRWFERYVFSHSDHAVAGNAEAIDVLRAKGYGGPTSVIPQFGVDPEAFAPQPVTDSASHGPFTIGYVGRLTPEKGLDVLLDAVARLDGDWRLRFVGNGPMREALMGRAASLGIGAHVQFSPAVPSTQVPDQLRRLDVLVLPSLTRPNWKEQFGRVLQEAMACGVPVVGSDSGEIPHVVGDGGSIVPEGDASALAAALQRLAADPELRRELGQRGRARVLERFTQASVARRTVEVYRQMTAP